MDAFARFLAARPMPAAVVADAGGVGALAAIRALAGAGLPVVALDHRREALGFKSRFAFPALCPDPADRRDEFVAFARALAAALARKAPVFPLSDAYADALTTNAEALGERFVVAPPPAADREHDSRAFVAAYWTSLGARVPRRLLEDQRAARFDPGASIARLVQVAGGGGR